MRYQCNQTACVWSRQTEWILMRNGAGATSVNYHPGNISVEYNIENNGRVRVARVLLYSGSQNPAKRRLKQTFAHVPTSMRKLITRMVINNERDNGNFITAGAFEFDAVGAGQ